MANLSEDNQPRPPLLLYDIPSRFGACWSPNSWRTRLLLNYKGIEYETVWLDFPEIAPTLKSFGIQPHTPGTQLADYTVPTVRLPDGSYVTESKAIVRAVESLYPDPSAHLDYPKLDEVELARRKLSWSLGPVIQPNMPRNVLPEVSIPFHHEARKRNFGLSLEELERFGGEQAWEKAMPDMHTLANALKADPSGPYCMGQTPSYADFVIVGFMEWCRCVGGGCFERFIEVDPVFLDVYNACKPWLERNDR